MYKMPWFCCLDQSDRGRGNKIENVIDIVTSRYEFQYISVDLILYVKSNFFKRKYLICFSVWLHWICHTWPYMFLEVRKGYSINLWKIRYSKRLWFMFVIVILWDTAINFHFKEKLWKWWWFPRTDAKSLKSDINNVSAILLLKMVFFCQIYFTCFSSSFHFPQQMWKRLQPRTILCNVFSIFESKKTFNTNERYLRIESRAPL